MLIDGELLSAAFGKTFDLNMLEQFPPVQKIVVRGDSPRIALTDQTIKDDWYVPDRLWRWMRKKRPTANASDFLGAFLPSARRQKARLWRDGPVEQ